VIILTEQLTHLEVFDEFEREQWRMDSQNSFALFEWGKVIRGEETYYRISESIEIRPWPNPHTFGGMWGSSSAKTIADVELAKTRFFEYVSQFKKWGMTRFEEKGMPEWNLAMDTLKDDREAPHPLKRDTNQLVMELDD